MANRYYRDINDLINNSNKNIAKSIEGDYSSLVSKEGATQNQIDARLEAINLGKEKSIHKQITQIQTELEGMGFGLRFSIDKSSGHIKAIIIPRDDSNYLSPTINKKDIEKYAALDFHIDIDGEVKKAGLRGKNHLIFDSDQSKVLGYTFVEAQLEEEISFLRSKRGKELLRQTTSSQGGQDAIKEINKTIKKRGAGALEKMSLAGDSAQSISGTASAKNQALMASIIEADKLFETAFRENYKTLSHSRQKSQSISSFKGSIKKEAYIASYLLSQGVPVEKIKNDPRFQHIASSSGFLKTIKNFSNLGLHMGHTGEDAASDYQFTQLPQGVLTGGAFDEKSSRKRRQVSNILIPNMTLEERMKLGAKRGGSLTKFEKKAGISLDSAENATFGVRYVTQDDYNKAVKKTEEEFAKKGVKIKIRAGIDSDAGIYASSMGKAFDSHRVTPSKFSRKDYDKIYSNLEKNNTSGLTKEQLEDEAIRVLIRDKYGYDNNWNGNLIRKDLSSNANFIKVDFEEMRKMKSGNKLLGQHANVRATFQEQEDEIFNALRRNLGLDKDAQIILGESKISGKNISGVIAETLEGFVSRANEDKNFDLKNELSKSKLLNKFYAAKQDNSGNWILSYKKSIEELDAEIDKISDEKGLGDFFKEINNLAKTAYNTTKNFFNVLKDGTVKRTKSWKGRSAYNQIDQYQYGAPEGRYTSFGHRDNRVVSLDYRGGGALEREVGLLESSTGKSRTALKTFLDGATAVDPEEIKRLRELQTNADASIKKTKQTAKEDFNINSIDNATVVGWGDKPDDLNPNIQWINLADYENADNELSDGHMDAMGFYDSAAFNKTSWAKIMEAQKRGDVYFKHNMGLVGYEDQYGNKILGTNDYVNLADLQVEADVDGVDAQGNPLATGYKINENIKKALSSMKFRTRDASSGEALDIEYGEESILEYLKTIFNDVNSKEGTSWQRGNKAHLFHSAFSKVNAANISGYYDLANKDNRTAEEDLELKLMTTAATGNIEDAREMLGFANKKELDNPMDKFETLMLKYQKLYNFESEDDTYNRFLEDINKHYNSEERKKKDKEEAEKHYEENKNKIWENYHKVGDFKSVYDYDNHTWVDFIDAEDKRDYLLNKQEELKKTQLEEIENRKKFNSFDDIKNLTRKGSIRGVVKFLIEQMIDAVTLGSDSLSERIKGVEAAKAAGNNINLYGLAEIIKRYPESNGLDEKFVEVFLDKAVEKGVTRLGIGLAKSFNADNDGDNIARYLALADSEQMGRILKAKDKKEVVDSMYDAADMFSAINKVVAEREMRVRAEDEKSAGVIKPKEWQKLLDPNTQIITTVSSRINKSKTGSLSNEYQGVAEAMSFLGIDEKGVGKDLDSQKKAASAAIARSLFESFTQDAISSKKVADRISVQRGESWAEEDSAFFDELDNLVADLSKPETYKNIDGLIARIQDMGILGSGSESVFTDRIESELLATINRMSRSVDIFKDIFGEETLLNAVGKNDIKDITQNDIDKAIASGSIKLTAEQLIPQLKIVNQSLDEKGGIGGVIRGRKWIVPGLLNATSNPVGMLGDTPESLGAPYDALKEKVLGVKQAVDTEREAEEQKIGVLSREREAIKQTVSEYNNLGDVLAKIAKQHGKTIEELTADDINDAFPWLKGMSNPISASIARNMMLSEEAKKRYKSAPVVPEENIEALFKKSRNKHNKGEKITIDDIGETLGFRHEGDVRSFMSSFSAFNRGSFIGNVAQLREELGVAGIDSSIKNGESDEEYISRLGGLGSNLVSGYYNWQKDPNSVSKDMQKYYSNVKEERIKTVKGYIDGSTLDEHNQQTDITTLFNKLQLAEEIFADVDKSFSVRNLLTGVDNIGVVFDKLGVSGENIIGTEVGSTGVIKNRPFATTADLISKQYVEKDGKKYAQAVITDIKSHAGDNFKKEDAFQVAMEQYGLDELVKVMDENPDAFKDSGQDFESFQKTIIEKRLKNSNKNAAEINEILSSTPVYPKDFVEELVETRRAGIDTSLGRILVHNKYTGNATAYDTAGLDYDRRGLLERTLKQGVTSSDRLSKEEAEVFTSAYGFRASNVEFAKKAELNKEESEYVELLKEEFKLKKELLEWEAQHKKVKNENIDVYNLAKQEKLTEINKAEKATELAANKAKIDPNDNDLRRSVEASIELEKIDEEAKLKEKTKKETIDDLGKKYRNLLKNETNTSIEIEKLKTEQLKSSSIEEFNAIQAQIDERENFLKNISKDRSKIQGKYTRALGSKATDYEKEFIDEQNKELAVAKLDEQTKRAKRGLPVDANSKKQELADKVALEASIAEEQTKKKYVDLLKEEYQLKLKIAELKARKELSTDEKEKENIDKIISLEDLNRGKIEEARKAAYDKVTDKDYKNNVLSAEEAKYQLELQKQAERLAKGTDGIVGKKSLFDDFGRQFKGYIVNMFSAYRIISKITQELRKCVQIAKELDKAATNIRIVTGMSSEEVDLLMRKYTGLARELGVTTQIVAQSGQEWMRQGYSAEQANDLIASSTKLSKLGMMDMNNATKVLTSTMKGFKLEASDVGQVVDKLTKLDMNYATTAADIGEAMSRTAAIAHQMGVSLDETAAMVTTIMDITQQSAEMTGTAIRTILSRYGNVKSGSFVSMLTDGEDLDKINDIEKVLSVLGIEIRKSGLEMRDVGDVLDQLALKWTTLSDVEKNAVATAFAGTRQRNQFVVLMDNWKQVEEATDMAANAAGTADDKYGAYMDSIEARLNKLQTAWEEFTQKLSTSSFVKGAVSVLTFLVEHLDKILTLLGSISAYLMAKKLWTNVGKLGGIFNGLSTIGFKKGAADAAANPNGGIINRIFGTTQKGFTAVSSKLDQIMAIMNGEQTGDAAMSVVDSMAVTRRAKLSEANELEIEIQKEKLKRSKTNKAQIQSKIDRLEAQNSALKGKGFDVGNGKTITMRKGPNGGMIYYETTVNQKTQKPRTRKIGSNSADAQNALALKKAQTKQRLAGAGAMGLASGFMAGMSGTNSYFGNMIGGENVKINDIKSDTTDNIINGVATGAATGLLSAIPGVGPILGPMLGPVLGDLLGSWWKQWNHRDDIARKERVEEAKKNLEALNKVQSAIESAENSIFDMSTPESVSKAKNDVDAIIDALLESDNREKILSRLNKTVEEIEGTLLTGTEEEKREILSVINSENNSSAVIETFNSQEQDRYDAYKKYNDLASKEITINNSSIKGILEETGYYKDMVAHTTDSSTIYYTTSLSGNTSADKAKNASEFIKELNKKANSDDLTKAEKEFLDGEIKRLQGIVDAHNDYQAEILKMNKEVNRLEIRNAFSKSGFDKWTSLDVSSASIEEVVQTFANNLELTGAAVRDSTGEITDYARLQIETFLRSNERFSSLFSSSGKTLNQIMSSLNKQKDLLDQTQAASFEELKNAFDTQNKDSILTYLQNMGYGVEDLTYTLEDGTVKFTNTFETASNELMRLVYKYDDSQIEGIAKALNMTTEDLLEMRKLLGNVKLSDLILSPEETRSSFNELNNIFSELSTSGAVTGENLEKLNTKYFSLYNNYDENGDVINTSFNNVLENLRKRLFGDQNTVGTQGFLYQNATFQTLKEDSGLYDSFYYKVKNNLDLYNLFDENQRKLLESANSLTDIMHLFNDETFGGEMQNILIEILNDMKMNNDYYKEIQDKLIEWQKHENDTVIDNLKSQIDALNDVNKEREKEIALIKAKDALENAKKEKVRVYRAGVGWTYEANQQKVSDAKEDLEKLERENNAENLQYQIDLLEKQNSMLDNISKNEELKGLKNSVDSYVSYMRNTFGKDIGSNITSLLDNSNYIMKWDEYVQMMGKQAKASVLDEQGNILKNVNAIKKIDAEMAAEKNKNSSKYIGLQEERNKAVESIQESKQKLSNWDVGSDDLKNYLTSEGVDERYTNIDNGGIYSAQTLNERYYTVPERNKEGETLKDEHGNNKEITLKATELYSNDEISKALQALESGDDKLTVVPLLKNGQWGNRITNTRQLDSLENGSIVHFGADKSSKKNDVNAYAIKDGISWRKLVTPEPKKYGTLGLNSDILALINEVGTEGIVTPQGTITALPSKTGIVPADLTENLYRLGEVAPNLIKNGSFDNKLVPISTNSKEDNSMNIDNFYATFETDDGFDFEKLLISARQYIKNTKKI